MAGALASSVRQIWTARIKRPIVLKVVVGHAAAEMPPDRLDRAESRRIGQQEVEPELAAMAVLPFSDRFRLVNAIAVRNHHGPNLPLAWQARTYLKSGRNPTLFLFDEGCTG